MNYLKMIRDNPKRPLRKASGRAMLDEREHRAALKLDKPTTRKRKHSGATCTPDARLTRLIERWRREANKLPLDSLAEASEIHRCADQLEKCIKP